jgi:hypothetical protein
MRALSIAYRWPNLIFLSFSAFRSARTIAFLRRSRLLVGFSKNCDCLTTAITPACCTFRLNRRSKFSKDSFESLRVTCIISLLFYRNRGAFARILYDLLLLGSALRLKHDALQLFEDGELLVGVVNLGVSLFLGN